MPLSFGSGRPPLLCVRASSASPPASLARLRSLLFGPLFPANWIEISQTSLVRVVVLRRQSDGCWAFMYGRLAPRNRQEFQRELSHFARTTVKELRLARASTCTFLLPIPPEDSWSPHPERPALYTSTALDRKIGSTSQRQEDSHYCFGAPNQSRIPSLGPPQRF